MKKFNVGDKVVPVSKSVWGTLEESSIWRTAQGDKQDFLYVTGYETEPNCVVCHYENLKHSGGDFFKESDLIPYTEGMVTDVKTEKLITKLELLITEAQTIIKDLKIEQKNKAVAIVVAVNARQQIINEAKEFVEEYRSHRKDGETRTGVGNDTAKNHFYETAFAQKGNKITALVYRLRFGRERQSNKPNHVGKAVCLEGDTFNQYIGEAIALGRALDINVDKFINAVQPTEFAVGQVIEVDLGWGESCTEVITSIQNDRAYVSEFDFYWLSRAKEDRYKILDDTNATYEVK